VNLEGFLLEVQRNQQIPHGGTDLDGAYVFYTDNAGTSIINGGEVSIKYLLTPQHGDQPRYAIPESRLQQIHVPDTCRRPPTPAPLTGCPYSQ